MDQRTELAWVKATASSGNGNCVEVADLGRRNGVLIRDSKNPEGTKLYFSDDEWTAFLDGVYRQEFNFPR